LASRDDAVQLDVAGRGFIPGAFAET
jgi:hypothetical protein